MGTGWPAGDRRSGDCWLAPGCTSSSCTAGSEPCQFQVQCAPPAHTQPGRLRTQECACRCWESSSRGPTNGRGIALGKVIWGHLPDCPLGPHPSLLPEEASGRGVEMLGQKQIPRCWARESVPLLSRSCGKNTEWLALVSLFSLSMDCSAL